MSTSDAVSRAEAIATLAAVARLLCRAADLMWEQTHTEEPGLVPAIGLGTQLAASHALAMLPDWAAVDEPAPLGTDPGQLLAAADELTRLLPVEAFPPEMPGLMGWLRVLTGRAEE